MGKSKKKNLINKSGRWLKALGWKIIRSNWKQQLRKNPIDPEFADKHTIINQYDITDYVFTCNGKDNCYCIKNYGRKKCFDK